MNGETVEDLFARYGPAYRWLVTSAGLIGAFAMVFSATVVNVAVPSVMGAFGVGQDQAQWMATAFLATMTASQLLNAWMVAAFGQRLAFAITLGIFIVGTMFSGFAPNMDVLIFGRILQGCAAGIIQPLVMVTMFQVFPADRRGLAMGIYGTGVVIAPAIGPAIGGIAIDVFSWRHIFFMPLPFCFVALFLGSIFMPAKGRSSDPLPRFDWIGYALLCTALVLLLSASANGPRYGWTSDRILGMAVLGTLAAAAFVVTQLRGRAPLLDMTLFRNPRFAAALLVAFVFGAGNFASSYVIPVFVQAVQGYTATKAGLVLMPAGLLLVLSLPLTGRLSDHVPDHVPIMLGLVCFAIGAGLMVDSDVNTGFYTFALFAMISRFGLAFIIPSLSAAALRALPPEQLNRGSGNVNFIRQLGGACGVNLIVVWLQQRTYFHSDVLTATQTAANGASEAFLGAVSAELAHAGLSPDVQMPFALDYLGKVVYAQATTMGFQDSFLMLALVFLLALIPAWLLGRTNKAGQSGADRAEKVRSVPAASPARAAAPRS